MEKRRKAIVAGSFYDSDRDSLLYQIKNCFLHEVGPGILPDIDRYKNERKIKGIISPHAGFVFSGPVAAHGYLKLSYEKEPDTIVIIGPNHRGFGKEISIMSNGYWDTPLGTIGIDENTAKNIMNFDKKNIIEDDIKAHTYEHSIEVQLPFLQYIYPNKRFKIIPISVINQQLSVMNYLAEVLFKATEDISCLYIASSDFTHYENQESAKRKDTEAIERIINMDSNKLYDTIKYNNTTICGPGPISLVIEICKKYKVEKGILLKYATSGDVSGMNEQVVGYASIMFQ